MLCSPTSRVRIIALQLSSFLGLWKYRELQNLGSGKNLELMESRGFKLVAPGPNQLDSPGLAFDA